MEAGLVMSGNLTSAVLRFTVTMILFMVLSEADMGYLGVFIALMDMVSIFCECGLHSTLVRFMSASAETRPQPLILRCLRVKLILCALCVLPLVLARGIFISVQGIEAQYRWLYPVAVAGGVLLSFNTFGMAVLQGRERYGLYTVLAAAINAFRLAIIGLMVLLKIRDPRLYLGAFFALPAAAVLLALILVPAALPRNGRERKPADATTGELLRFMWPLAVLQILAVAITRVDFLMLQSLTMDPEVVANYLLAFQIAFVFPLLTRTLFTILLPKVSAMKSAEALKHYRRRILHFCPGVFLLTVAAAAVAPFIITLVFKDKYQSALPIVRLLVLAYGMDVIINPLGLIFYAVGRTHYIPIMHALQLVIFLVANWLLIPLYAGVGAAIACVIIRTVAVAFTFTFTAKVINDVSAHSPGNTNDKG